MNSPLPLTLITGFLGAGKTTLIRKILQSRSDLRFGLIENEYAPLNLDAKFLEGEQAWVEQTEGCLCCRVQGDLLPGLQNLIESAPTPLDHLIIETTGLADPTPLIQALLSKGPHRQLVQLDSTITLVDGLHFFQQKSQLGELSELTQQILQATRLVITKKDLLSETEFDEIQSALTSLNADAPVESIDKLSPPEASWLEQKAYELQSWGSRMPRLIKQASTGHTHTVVGTQLIELAGWLVPQTFEMFLNVTAAKVGTDILRTKGILALDGQPHQVYFHGVFDRFEFELGPLWPTNQTPLNQIILIGNKKAALIWEGGFQNCLKIGD